VPVLLRDGERDRPGSLLDLYGSSPVLVCGADGSPWRRAGEDAARRVGVRLRTVAFGGELRDASEEGWHQRYGVTADGAVLVRPDGFVAWRSAGAPADGAAALEAALRRTLARDAD
jgi:hypothetical protein